MRISVFEVMSVQPIEQYQNTTPRAMLFHELKKVQLQERVTLMTQDSTGHLKTLCMSIFAKQWCLSPNGRATAHRSALKKT